MRRWVRLSVPFVVGGEAIDDHAFDVLDQLHELSDIRDPDVYVNLGDRIVTLELLSIGETDLDAVKVGLAAMRTAIHVAGGMTHGWEDDFSDLSEVTLFPLETPTTEWEPTQTTFERVLIDA